MKYILSLIISGALVVSGFGQTRNVLVNTNNVVVQPTNFWSADASNARSGLGLGSAATNASSAFQGASLVLSNLASSNAVDLTNLRATNIVGTIPSSNISTVSLTNISGTLAIASGGTGATNADTARTNLGIGATNSVEFKSVTATNGINFKDGFKITSENGSLEFIEPVDDLAVLTIVGDTDPVVLREANWNYASVRQSLGLGTNSAVRFAEIFLYTDGEVTNSIQHGADSLFFIQNGNIFFSMDSAYGGNVDFQRPIYFSGTNTAYIVAQTRTNLGLGWSGLTNTNASGFQISLFGSNTNPVLVNTNGTVVSPTNFWQQAPIATTVAFSAPITNSTNAATNSRNLIIQSLATNIVNVTNTLLLPTNTSTFNGDTAVVIHAGGANSATAVRQAGQTSNLIVITNFDHAVRFLYFNNEWDFYHNLAYVEPIYFSGTNAAANAAASRTNLGIPLAALTNTNTVNFRTAIGLEFNYESGDAQEETAFLNSLGLSSYDAGSYSEGNISLMVVGGAISLWPKGQTNAFSGENSVFEVMSYTLTNITNGTWSVYERDKFRKEIELSLPALTNTNNANFQAAVFTTNTAPTNSANVNTVNFNTAVAWIQITVSTNGTNHSFRIPLFQ